MSIWPGGWSRKPKASSTSRLLSALRRFYQYLIREQLREEDPPPC